MKTWGNGWLGLLVCIILPPNVEAEVIRVTPSSPLLPGYYVGRPLDLNGDGKDEFDFAFEQIITLDYPTSSAVTTLTIKPATDCFLAGSGYSVYPVGQGWVAGTALEDGADWISTTYRFSVASRSHNYRAGTTSAWQGVLADSARSMFAIRFVTDDGVHYGWVRFGRQIGFQNIFTDGAAIIEWAYESVPDKPVTISLPDIPNDSFAMAAGLPGTHFSLWSDNSLATAESGEPNPGGLGDGASLWWRWTAPADGDLWIASKTGPFESVFGVFTGPALEHLNK